MFHFFRHRYDGYRPVRYVVNPVRCVEVVLCLACLALAIIMVITLPYMSVVVKVILTLTAAAYSIITIMDLISNCYKNPIYWNTWILFALSGALLFFLCVGMLIATNTGTTVMLIIGEIFNAVTGIIFLLDALLILLILRKRLFEIWPEDPCLERKPSEPYAPPEEVPVVVQNNIIPVCDCGEPTPPNKSRSSISYGGTFPVSKNDTPLPSPEPKRSRSDTTRRKSTLRLSGSQTLTTPTSGNLQRGPDGRVYLGDGTPLTEVVMPNGEVEYQDSSGVLYTSDGIPIVPDAKRSLERIKSKEMVRSVEIRPYAEYSTATTPTRTGSCKLYLSDGTPLVEVTSPSGVLMFEGPNGELYNADGTPLQSHPEKKKPLGSKKQKRDKSPRVVCRQPSPRKVEREQSASSVSSRTVAVSTRMVPKSKSQKPGSAPASSESKVCTPRTCKSAETPPCATCQYQQQPQLLYHQIMQRPCGCGRMHFQTVSTVQGSVCPTNDSFYGQQDVPNVVEPTPPPPPMQTVRPPGSPPCQKPSCAQFTQSQTSTGVPPSSCAPSSSCSQPSACVPPLPCGSICAQPPTCAQSPSSAQPSLSKQAPSSLQMSSQSVQPTTPKEMPGGPLQTISECECESEAVSSGWDDRETDVSLSQHTSTEYAASCSKCYVCGDRNCRTHTSQKSTGNDSVQTSETRMIRASDIQRMNVNLQGPNRSSR